MQIFLLIWNILLLYYFIYYIDNFFCVQLMYSFRRLNALCMRTVSEETWFWYDMISNEFVPTQIKANVSQLYNMIVIDKKHCPSKSSWTVPV